MDQSLEDLEREITCAICLDHFTQPKVLPCSHYYCKQCIINVALRTGTDKPFSCPECRKEVILLEGSVDQLPTAFIVNRFKVAFASLERAHGKVEVKCEACKDSGTIAKAFCRQCEEFICQECANSHQRMKIYRGHKVVSLEQLKQGRAKEIVKKENPAKKCVVHEEPLNIYCFDCNSFICRDCTIKDHKDHNFEFCKIVAADTRKQLTEKLECLREVEVNLSCAAGEIQTTKHDLAAQADSVVKTIRTSFDELLQILEKHKRELLVDVLRGVREKTDKLSLQEKNLSLANAEIQSVRDYAKRSLSLCADNDVIGMRTELTSQIKREIEEHGKLGRSVMSMEKVDIEVEAQYAETLQHLCQTIAEITQLTIDPAKCTATVKGAKIAEVNTVSDLTLITGHSNNQSTKLICKVDCHLKSLYDGSVIKCNADRIGISNYSLQYTPTVRGRHELTVSVDGQQMAGSPFPMFVFLPLVQLGKHVRVWSGLSYPAGVTVNSLGEIIVTERQGDVITFDREGNRLRSVKHKFGFQFSVAVDGMDNIYCTDVESNKVFTSNMNGGNVQVHDIKQVGGAGHLGVAVVGDEVMMCQHYNKGTIMVYDRELKYVRQIVGRDMGGFGDLSPDSHGNLYVTDWHNSCIRVFRNDGGFLRSFSCDGNGVKMLSGPRGVCVAGQHVYVTDVGNHNVSVFTTEGEYVTSFGQHGSEEGDFSNPSGVCIDRDNFVYVADCYNNRVQIF